MKSRWAFPALMAVVIPGGLVLAAAWAMKRYMQDGQWAGGASRQRWDWPSSGDRRWAWPESGDRGGATGADRGATGAVDAGATPPGVGAAGDGTRIVH